MGALIQSIDYEGVNIPWQLLEKATYIESLDLTGPKLILVFSDQEKVLRDGGGIKEREGVLTVAFADPEIRDETYFEERFTIENLSERSDRLQLECVAEAVSKLYRISKTCTIYPAGSPDAMVKQITGGEVESSAFPEASVYHELVGMRPVQVLDEMVKEVGARLFYRRGKFYLKSYDDLFKQEPAHEYFYLKPLEYKIISHVESFGDLKNLDESLSRKFMGFNFVEGLIETGQGRPVMTGLESVDVLTQLNRQLIPELDLYITSDANPDLLAGQIMEVEWNRPADKDSPLNEALPTSLLIGQVSHHQEKGLYTQRLVTLREVVHE